jgi:4-carboxymuconolactone decarboxylase
MKLFPSLPPVVFHATEPGATASVGRFRPISPDEMTEAQRALVASIQAGPRGKVAGSAANASPGTVGGPFNVFLRSPKLGEIFQQAGGFIRFESSLGAKLTELAILVTARYWSAQYEWFAHHRLALQAGLDPKIADAIAQNRVPEGMQPEEEAVYQFTRELHLDKQVSDATYARVVDLFGEQGVMDLIGTAGYYSLISMVLNVDRTPIPNGGEPPLAPMPPR